MECRIAPLRDFTRADLDTCAVTLCRDGSEMQVEFLDGKSDTPVAVVYDGIHPVAWAASHIWRGLPTLEGFTRERYRKRGLQRFAASGLIASGSLNTRLPVVVFSPLCVLLTRSLGWSSVRQFRRSEGDWIEVPE